MEDGPLLKTAQEGFDILLTIDGSLEFQQNFSSFQMGVIIVHVSKNQIAHCQVIETELLAAIEVVRPGKVIHVRARPA